MNPSRLLIAYFSLKRPTIQAGAVPYSFTKPNPSIPEAKVKSRAADLLKQMTLDEKIALGVGDLGCGAITSTVLREGGTFVWKDFGLQNNYDDNVALTAYQGVGPFTFDAATYERALVQARDKLPAL
jgi:hypothetical protein